MGDLLSKNVTFYNHNIVKKKKTVVLKKQIFRYGKRVYKENKSKACFW